MFDLVADVGRYPQFVPLCQSMKVRSRDTEGRIDTLIATMTVAYGPLSESYTSRVTLDRPALAIRTEAIDGPFRSLDNAWSFEPMDEDECQVRFAIDYAFRSRTLGLVMGGMFDRAFRKFAAAFEARADAIYGRR
jgi:coenzyme Q-binding protein COQ10